MSRSSQDAGKTAPARRSSAQRPLAPAPYGRRVFINCPFDDDYLPILQAIAFTVIDCGFMPQLAVQEVNGRVRLEKIIALMRESRLSIHDISRLPTRPGEAPRFNMPFECGVFVGLAESGAARHRDKAFLLLDETPYQSQKTMSDVAGLDPKIHGGDPKRASDCVRHFLASELRRLTKGAERVGGGQNIWSRYEQFQRALPAAAAAVGLSADAELRSFDYLTDLIELMTAWIRDDRSA